MKTVVRSIMIITIISIIAIHGFARSSFAMGLKENVVLTNNVITLGDIFYDLPRDKSKVLGPAPRPGTDMVLNARTLMRIALALDLPWRPINSSEYVVLKRAATLISKNAIQNAIKSNLKDEGYDQDIEIDFPTETSEIVLPQDMPPTFDIISFEVNHKSDWFEATIAAPSKDNPVRTNRVSGKIHRMVHVPVLRDTLRNGSIIGKNDIDTIAMRAHDVSPQFLLDPESLIGMTPRRVAFAGKPLLEKEVEAPRIVGRGEVVTMVLESGALRLTAIGKSLENGAKGDIVRVVNTSSSRTIQGTVTGQKEITVQTF